MNNLHKGATPKLFQYARHNRQPRTDVEKILWEKLRNRKLNGFKFRRQHPIANYIADFFCLSCNLVIEVDGDYHNEPDQKQYDEARTHELSKLNIKVIRFTNHEVLQNIDAVLKTISHHLPPPIPKTSPPGEETPLS